MKMLCIGGVQTIVFSLFIFSDSVSILDEKETKLALDLLTSIGIRHCIFLETFCDFKKFSSEGISGVYFTYNTLIRYLAFTMNGFNLQYIHTQIAIILKEGNAETVKIVLNAINQIGRTSQMDTFTWIWLAGISPSTLDGNNPDLIRYSCQFIIAQPVNLTAYQLREIYMVKTKLFYSNFGFWDYDQGLKLANVSLYWRRLDLNQTEVKFFTHVQLMVPEMFEVFEDFGYMMNFRFVNVFIGPGFPVPDVSTGIQYFVLASGSSLFARIPSAIGPVFENTIQWYVKYPHVERKADYYLQPFEIDLWIGLAFAISASTFVILLLHLFSNKLQNDKSFILIDNIFMGLDAFCNQNGSAKIIRIPIRIVCITLRAASLILLASYLGVIMSFLTVEIPKVPFKDKETFIENGNYKLYLESVKVIFYIEAELRVMPQLILHMPGLGLAPVENMSRICKEKIAYAAVDNDFYSKKIPCKILKIQEPLLVTKSFISLAGSEFKRAFEENLLRYYESGLQDRIQDTISDPFLEKKSHDREGEITFRPVEISQMVQVLLIPFFGVGLSVVLNFFEFLPTFIRKVNWKKIGIFLREIITCKWRKKRPKQRHKEKKNRFRPALQIDDWYF